MKSQRWFQRRISQRRKPRSKDWKSRTV